MRLALPVRGPFHLQATARLLQRRPGNRVDVLEGGAWHRLFFLEGAPVLVRVINEGSVSEPRVSAQAPAQLEATLVRVLGLDQDTSAFEALAAREPRIARLVRALRGARPPRYPALFEAFANAIPFQQVSLDAGTAIVGRLVDRLGRSAVIDGRRWSAFPEPEAVAGARLAVLRQAGLSERKARALQQIAARIAEGSLAEAPIASLPTREAQAALEKLPGIGPWSAGLVLLRGLGRLDAFPAGDVGMARSLAPILGLPTGAVEGFARRFEPFQGLFYFLALGSSLLAKGLIDEAED